MRDKPALKVPVIQASRKPFSYYTQNTTPERHFFSRIYGLSVVQSKGDGCLKTTSVSNYTLNDIE